MLPFLIIILIFNTLAYIMIRHSNAEEGLQRKAYILSLFSGICFALTLVTPFLALNLFIAFFINSTLIILAGLSFISAIILLIVNKIRNKKTNSLSESEYNKEE